MSTEFKLIKTSLSSKLLMTITTLGCIAAFSWPLWLVPKATTHPDTQAPFFLGGILLALLALTIAQLSSGGFDVKALAMLGILTAIGAVLRPLGTGAGGFETVFFLLVFAGRAYGAIFGFLLGNTTLLTSALLISQVGYWLPYQMIAAGFVGMGAGLLPKCHGRIEIALLAIYGAISGFTYGWAMDFAFWPFFAGPNNQTSYNPADPINVTLSKFILFNIATSMAWNAGRALTNLVLICLLGRPLLKTLRRSGRRGFFTP